MNKTKAGSLLIVMLLIISGIAIAQEEKENKDIRVIADTTSLTSKLIFKINGCRIIHELNDATALKCPAGVAAGLKNVREDRIFNIIDLEADEQINADDVWAQEIDGTGVNVAVLDTGIDMDHPELSDCYIDGYDYVDDDSVPEDWHGHGTHVSGIITANGIETNAKGVAPGAGIYMYKVCGTYGCYESDMMAAMEAAVLTDAKVMSISIGRGNFAGTDCDTDPLAAAVNEVVKEGITVVVASGNDRFFVSSPGCASGAIAVGAVDKTGLMASFSNFGPSLDIVAPGVSIYSSIIDGYAPWQGTSMSTPHVSGTVALMLEANPGLTVDEIKTALYDTADPINLDSVCYGVVRQRGAAVWIGGVECTSDNYGAGIVDAYGAVNYYLPEEPECTEDGDCVDEFYCNGEETCVSGFCQSGIPIDCSYLSNQCNDGVCDEVTGSCINQSKADGTLCDDALFCTENDYCSAGTCLSVTSKTCDDGETCTTDSCNEFLSVCENIWPECGIEIEDGCCGPLCTSTNDADCAIADPCGNEICAGSYDGQSYNETCRTCPSDCLCLGKDCKNACCGDGYLDKFDDKYCNEII